MSPATGHRGTGNDITQPLKMAVLAGGEQPHRNRHVAATCPSHHRRACASRCPSGGSGLSSAIHPSDPTFYGNDSIAETYSIGFGHDLDHPLVLQESFYYTWFVVVRATTPAMTRARTTKFPVQRSTRLPCSYAFHLTSLDEFNP